MSGSSGVKLKSPDNLGVRIKKHMPFYIFLLPAFIWFLAFAYYPMHGLLMAFKNYSFTKGVWESPWVGMRYFNDFLNDPYFWTMVKNTLRISIVGLIVNFPLPIVLALMLNAVRVRKFKRTVQTVSYLPHFVSWVVVAALVYELFSPYGGLINDIRESMGLEAIFYLGQRNLFIPFVTLSNTWKSIGFNSIIFLAAITGIDQQLYEAADIDGANAWQKLWNITLPSIAPIIGLLFLLNIGGLFNVNMEQVLLLQTPMTSDIAEVLQTYILRRGILRGQLDYATAIGLFQGAMSFLLVFLANWISRKTTSVSIW